MGTPHINRAQKNGIANPDLRSAIEVIGYDLKTRDGKNGYVEDIYIDMKNWQVASVAVTLRQWFSSDEKALITPGNIEALNWRQHQMTADITEMELERRLLEMA